MAREYDLTSVGINPAEDRAHRMRTYFIAMSVRIACVASLFFVRGWWLILVGAAAIILPYFAVIVANQAEHRARPQPQAPSPLELPAAPGGLDDAAAPRADGPTETLLVVDAPADRRSAGTHHGRTPPTPPTPSAGAPS